MEETYTSIISECTSYLNLPFQDKTDNSNGLNEKPSNINLESRTDSSVNGIYISNETGLSISRIISEILANLEEQELSSEFNSETVTYFDETSLSNDDFKSNTVLHFRNCSCIQLKNVEENIMKFQNEMTPSTEFFAKDLLLFNRKKSRKRSLFNFYKRIQFFNTIRVKYWLNKHVQFIFNLSHCIKDHIKNRLTYKYIDVCMVSTGTQTENVIDNLETQDDLNWKQKYNKMMEQYVNFSFDSVSRDWIEPVNFSDSRLTVEISIKYKVNRHEGGF